MRLNGAQVAAIVAVVLVAGVALFPIQASKAAWTILGFLVLVVIFGVIPVWWRDRSR